jgi:hypothetical protein
MPPPTTIHITWNCDMDAYQITTPFRREYVDLLKQLIPASSRSYNDKTRTWSVTEQYLGPVQALSEKIFATKAYVVTRTEAEKARAAAAANAATSGHGSVSTGLRLTPLDNAILQFTKLLPFEAAQKAYREAAMRLHPDRNMDGTMENMTLLNTTWKTLCKDLYGKE